jgi:signal transduction histidine kinase
VASALSTASVHACQAAIFSAAVHARPRRAVQAAAGAVAAEAVVCALEPALRHAGFDWQRFAVWAAMTIAACALGSFVRVRRELVVALRERAQRAESEQQLRLREARLAERTRIAREMHDVLAHRISLLSVHAGALEFNREATPEELAEGLGVIRASARAAQEDLREVLGVLRDEEHLLVDPPQPTLADLQELIAESRQAGMSISEVRLPVDEALPALTGRTVYRVVQEALTNVRKHAPDHSVSIAVTRSPAETITVEVVDRAPAGASVAGRSLQPQHVGSGTGLVGLAERLALAGGRLSHGPLPDGGFRVAVTLPEAAETPALGAADHIGTPR